MQFNILWLNIRNPFFKVMLKISFRQNHMAICMCNENDKHDVEQRIANFCIHSLETGGKIISYIVCSWDDRWLWKSIFQNRDTLQIFNLWFMYKLGLTFN